MRLGSEHNSLIFFHHVLSCTSNSSAADKTTSTWHMLLTCCLPRQTEMDLRGLAACCYFVSLSTLLWQRSWSEISSSKSSHLSPSLKHSGKTVFQMYNNGFLDVRLKSNPLTASSAALWCRYWRWRKTTNQGPGVGHVSHCRGQTVKHVSADQIWFKILPRLFLSSDVSRNRFSDNLAVK